MNSRERVLAALNHRQPDRPPRDLGSTTATGIHPTPYRALKRSLGLPDDFTYVGARAQLARVEPAVIERFGIDCLPLIPQASAVPPTLDERHTYVDRWNIERRLPEAGGHYYVSHAPLGTIERPSDLDAYAWPAPAVDYADLQAQARHLRATTDKALVLNPDVGFMHQCQFLRGFDLWLMDLVSDPVLAGAYMDRVLEIWLAEAEAMMAAAAAFADVIIYADDIAIQDGLMVSPRTFARLLRPRLKRVFATLQGRGLKVLYHTCGSIGPLIGDLVDLGVDALNPVQVSAKGMHDTAALKKEWGARIGFWGAIDTQSVMPNGTPADVRREAFQRLDDLSPDGGYVLATVHDIQAEVPAANICALFDSAEEWSQTRG